MKPSAASQDGFGRAASHASSVDDYKARMQVISHKLVAGQPQLHVLTDAAPEPGFQSVTPDLEDVFFANIAGHSGR